MRILFVFALTFVVLSASLYAQPMRVLFVGNSYTHYNNMPKILEQMAEDKGVSIEVTMDAKSSHTF